MIGLPSYQRAVSDFNLYKTAFKLIFEALQQEQHYKMMMGEDAEVIGFNSKRSQANDHLLKTRNN